MFELTNVWYNNREILRSFHISVCVSVVCVCCVCVSVVCVSVVRVCEGVVCV